MNRPVDSIPTHLTSLDKTVLQRIAAMLPSTAPTVVEIGSYLGASACILADSISERHGRLMCVDTWTNLAMSEGSRDTFAEFTRNTSCFKNTITPVRCDSVEAAARIAEPIDLLFIDGDHSFEGCSRDLRAWLPRLRSGGIVALHDFDWADGVRESVRDYLFPLQDGPGYWEGNIYWTRVGRTPTASTQSVTSSVIVPTRGGKRFRPEWLAHVTRDHEGTNEFCVVYTGRTRLEEHQIASSTDDNGRVHDVIEPVQGLLAGRHRALAETTGDILIYLDDDVRIPDGWLDLMLEPFSDPSVHVVGCRYLPEYECEPPPWLPYLWSQNTEGRFFAHLSLLDYGTQTKEIDPDYVWGLCYAIRRETLIKVGGFHPDGYLWDLRRYRGDGESATSRLARQLKLKTIYQGKTAVFHQVPRSRLTVEYLERRAFQQGITESYTAVRSAAVAPQPVLRSWKDMFRPIKKKMRREFLLRRNDGSAIDSLMRDAHAAGIVFHQNEVRNDPKLLEWVLKPDYFDYTLPEGWQTYLAPSA